MEEEVTARSAAAANKAIELLGRAVDKTLFSTKVEDGPRKLDELDRLENEPFPDLQVITGGMV